MSREEYFTWTVEQHEYCLSLDGYTSEEIKAEYDRQHQAKHDSLEFNRHQFRL